MVDAILTQVAVNSCVEKNKTTSELTFNVKNLISCNFTSIIPDRWILDTLIDVEDINLQVKTEVHEF